MLILLPLSVALQLLVVCQLSGIDSISISFNYFQCQYSISFTGSTERGGVRARLTACVRRCQCQCVSLVSFRFVLSVFVCFFTALIVQFIRRHLASSLYYMFDKYQAAMLHSKM
jgi:hypothetical protein